LLKKEIKGVEVDKILCTPINMRDAKHTEMTNLTSVSGMEFAN
jgi:hypothetical protein